MPESQFEREAKAIDALNALMEWALQVRELFELASAPLPPPLIRLFAINGHQDRADSNTVQVPAISPPPRPQEAAEGWMWLPLTDARPVTLVKAILRENVEPMQPKEIVSKVQHFNPHWSATVIYNVGPRLTQGNVITKSDDGGWRLIDPHSAAVIHNAHVWGPKDVFYKHEIAAHRREIILHLLSVFPDGLQAMQIVTHLGRFEQCQAPVNKDLVKEDMASLQAARKAKRISNSGKWILVKEE